MGRPWCVVAMPLLSTLAALVILAHSAEEEQRRHDLSPRLSEPASPDYDQSWRAVDGPTALQLQPEPEEWGVEITPQEPPKRRRPGRKRKRRPQPLSEEPAPEEQPYHADGRALDQQEQPEPPRRRRKRPEGRTSNRWTEEAQEQRPLRRRGHRRKQRPLTSDTEQNEQVENASNPPHDHVYEQEQTYEPLGRVSLDEVKTEQITMDDLISEPNEQSDPKEENPESDMSAADTLVLGHREVKEMTREEVEEEKTDKSYRVPYSLARKQEQSSDGTSKIKELLKQSGGLSLSELLQQRNLSLSDLLNGKQNAISALRSDSITVSEDSGREDKGSNQKMDHIHTEETYNINDSIVIHVDNYTTAQDNDLTTSTESGLSVKSLSKRHPSAKHYRNKADSSQLQTESSLKYNKTTEFPRRRLPPSGIRRNIRQRIINPHNESSMLRIRPSYNFMSAHPRRKENQTTTEPTPSQENENFIEVDLSNETNSKVGEHPEKTTNVYMMTTIEEISTTLPTTTIKEIQTDKIEEIIEIIENQTHNESEIVTLKLSIPALRPKILTTNSELRRQAQNNRHRKKRLRNKAGIPKNAEQIPVQELFGMANLVTASEFITKLQTTEPPTSTTTENDLPDLFTDESTNIGADSIETDQVKGNMKEQPIGNTESSLPKHLPVRQRVSVTTVTNLLPAATTEESAKEEILEVFKDMPGGARLAKILSERNMTINELVEHRERGSSQIHLADIFHNTSREPNPPEPFLSKSLIEPISKETYPLRALLEANSHDPAVKLASQNTYSAQFTNIPLIVDYGRNINENGENLGIIALFNEISNSKAKIEKNIKKDSEGTAYFTSVMSLNETNYNMREGRSMIDSIKKSNQLLNNLPALQNSDVKSEDEITHITHESSTTQGTTIPSGRNYPERDVDGDGLIVLEDLQRLNELDNLAHSINEKLEVTMSQRTVQPEDDHQLLGKVPSGVRSATIASAAIVGIGIVLFLLTYIGCKWRQRRRNVMQQNCERIPTPVFENRKSNRNCSTRSISPMLASNNGFTISTLESQTGKESPEYMWDTLHKPFQ